MNQNKLIELLNRVHVVYYKNNTDEWTADIPKMKTRISDNLVIINNELYKK